MHEEITKHTKKIYDEARSTKHSVGEKLREVLVEIFIIVFAVTISIWLHNWSEHRHQQKEVKEFLSDVKEDLQEDIANLKAARDTMVKNSADFLFLKDLTRQQYDSLHERHADLHLNARMATIMINTGDYEGFKSSGKIGNIEDKKLKSAILSYYEKVAPSVADMDKATTDEALKIINYILETDENEDFSKRLLGQKCKAKVALFVNYRMKTSIEMCDVAVYYANEILKQIDQQEG